jgi:hypothetical protein
MQTNDKEIMGAIAACNKGMNNQVNNLSRTCKMSPHLVKRHFDGSPLSLFELKQFADWKGRLPDQAETDEILYHGVGYMKKLFKATY